MANPLDRTWYNTLIDDDGSGTTGTIWNKAAVDGLMDTVDVSLAPVVANPVPGGLVFSTDASLVRSTADGADSGQLTLAGGGAAAVSRGAMVTVHGNEHASQPARIIEHLGTSPSAHWAVRRSDGLTVCTIGENGLVAPYGGVYFAPTMPVSADNNSLDQYQKKTAFTPALAAAGGLSGQTYSYQKGFAAKIGPLVIAQFVMAVSNKGTLAGGVGIQGFPFALDTAVALAPMATLAWSGLAVATGEMSLQMQGGQTFGYLTMVGPAGTTSNQGPVDTSAFATAFEIRGTVIYFTV